MSLLGFPLFRYIDINYSEEVMRAIHLTDPEIPLDLVLRTLGSLVDRRLTIVTHPARAHVYARHLSTPLSTRSQNLDVVR